MAWDGADGYVLLFGGLSVAGSAVTVLGDTWTFSNGTWRNITATVTGSPPPTSDTSMAYDAADGHIILFGGSQNGLGGLLNSTWSYRAGVWTNVSHLSPTAPSPRAVPGLAYDSTDGELLLAGGYYLNDSPTPGTWVYKAGIWTNVSAASPLDPHLNLPDLSDDPADHGVLMTSVDPMGPVQAPPVVEETFLYEGGKWKNLTGSLTQEPPLVYLGAMAYLPELSAVIFHSGLGLSPAEAFVTLAVTGEFVGGAWRNVTTATGTQPRSSLGPAIAVDPRDGAIITFGGEDLVSTNTTGDTWVLSLPPAVNVSTSADRLDAGGTASFQATVSNGLLPLTVQWSFGDGGNSSQLQASHRYASAGLYLATATAVDAIGEVGVGSVAILVAPTLSVSVVAGAPAPVVGSVLGFATEVTGGTPPFMITWSFGDGTSGTGPTVVHTYSSAKTYSLNVSVTDGAGSVAGAVLSVSVASAATSPNSGSVASLPTIDLAGFLILAAVAAGVGFALGRRRGGRPPAAAPASPSPLMYTGVPQGASGAATPPPNGPPG